MMYDGLFNTVDYTVPQLATSGIGGILWVIAYLITIRNILKYKFVEMPAFFGCANIAWEFLWGFIFYEYINMGDFYIWAYRAWFIFDLFIWISILRYGYKQIDLGPLRRHATWIFLGLTAAFSAILYAFISQKMPGPYLDYPMGGQSSYLLNFGISIVYITTWLRIGHIEVYSKGVAWTKMLGTLGYTIFFFQRFPESSFVLVTGSIIFVIDLIYLGFLYFFNRKADIIISAA